MKVIGLGDCVVDKYIHLNKMFPGGNALNFSVYAKKLGVESAAYMGILGTGKIANHIIKTLKKFDIDISRCKYRKGKTGYAEVDLIDGDRKFVGSSKGVLFENDFILDQPDLDYLNEFDLIHSSCFSNLESQLDKLKSLKIPISFDFSSNIDNNYLEKVCPKINYAFLSASDLSVLETKKLLKKAVDLGCEFALATRGEDGAYLYLDDKYYHQAADKVEPVDTLGAGDSFITSFLLDYISKDMNQEVVKKSLAKAAKFAAQTCLVYGAFGEAKEIK